MKKLALFAVVLLAGCTSPDDAAKAGAAYARSLYPDANVIASVPSDRDSDGDGYVSVTVRLEKGGQEKILNLQCSAGGCKAAMPIFNQ